MDELEGQLNETVEKIVSDAADLISSCVIQGPSSAIAIPSSIDKSKSIEKLGSIISKMENLEEKQNQVKDELLENKTFREMFYLHFRLQFIENFFPRFSEIILKITSTSLDTIYDVQFLA